MNLAAILPPPVIGFRKSSFQRHANFVYSIIYQPCVLQKSAPTVQLRFIAQMLGFQECFRWATYSMVQHDPNNWLIITNAATYTDSFASPTVKSAG